MNIELVEKLITSKGRGIKASVSSSDFVFDKDTAYYDLPGPPLVTKSGEKYKVLVIDVRLSLVDFINSNQEVIVISKFILKSIKSTIAETPAPRKNLSHEEFLAKWQS